MPAWVMAAPLRAFSDNWHTAGAEQTLKLARVILCVPETQRCTHRPLNTHLHSSFLVHVLSYTLRRRLPVADAQL